MAARLRVERILVLVRGGMGDAVRATPYLRGLRQSYPSAQITVACEGWSLELLRSCPFVDRAVALPVGSERLAWWRAPQWLAHRARQALLVARCWRRYDLVLVPPYGRRLNDWLARFASRRYRVGFGGAGGEGWTRNFGYPDYALAVEHHYARLFAAVGVRQVEPRLEVRCAQSDEEAVETFLREQAYQPPLFALHPGSDWSCQQWAPERWSRLAEELSARYGGTAILTGGAGDEETARQVSRKAGCRVIAAAGRFTPLQTAALLRRCRLAVCVDSVAPALALGVGTPVVVIEAWPRPDWQAWEATGQLITVRPDIGEGGLNERCRAAIGCLRTWCRTPECAGTGGLGLIGVADVLGAVERLWPVGATEVVAGG